MKKPRKVATAAQIGIAGMYNIPHDQAHTINIEKVSKYLTWRLGAKQRLERFLDNIAGRRSEAVAKGVVNED